ncbi:RagB/SusD family nutrient uptake outer membrane protein [Pedobacter sp. L105]|uniref:RagB/SusD family nutrient uptake outer membrane protein n=1 Tax=Pedobacter sp. L105 TaxID=1641871 RepID=UPI00131C3469|nr:RagB/SusD family nutrient uptake outer membrane protein [Pedobacter sp. L105]
MKKIYSFTLFSIAVVGLLLSSCKKPLDVTPKDTIEQAQALNTSKDVQAALVGAYSDLGNANFYGGGPFLMSDFLANTNAIVWTGTFEGLTQLINKAIINSNGFVEDVWLNGYKTINDVNNVISAVDKVDAADQARVGGEAKFIRGSVYFDLVRVFGKAYNDGSPATNLGVPIVLTPTTAITTASYVSRSTVAAVYQQVIKDLTDAEASLPESNGFFATKYTAAAMLARVYLQMGDYNNALNAANRVIASGDYQLASTFAKAFPTVQTLGDPAQPGSNTVEDIFAMQVTNLTGVNNFNTYYASSSYGGRGDASIDPDWIDATYETGDARKDFFYDDGDLFTSKFADQYGNVAIIRLAEMYLIRAEANVRLSTAVGATPLEDLAVIRGRAGLTTTSATLADILLERTREFAFEGFSLNDAKRTQTNIGSVAWNSTALIFPIPQRELDANKNLVQNTGY